MKVTDRWYSDRLGQDITVARWGTYGVPVLLFPTAGGDAEEVERHHLIAHLEPLIAAGRAKVYSVRQRRRAGPGRATAAPSSTGCALFNAFHAGDRPRGHPGDPLRPRRPARPGHRRRARRSAPSTPSPSPAATPSSSVAAVCMSGTYAIEKFIGGHVNDDLYFSLAAALPARPRGPGRSTCCAPGWSCSPRAAAAGRTSGSRVPSPTCSGARASPTASTTGAPPTTTTGRPGGRCSRSTSTTCSRDGDGPSCCSPPASTTRWRSRSGRRSCG